MRLCREDVREIRRALDICANAAVSACGELDGHKCYRRELKRTREAYIDGALLLARLDAQVERDDAKALRRFTSRDSLEDR